MTNKTKDNRVWMKCRAHEDCEGQYAIVKSKHSFKGAIESSTGGRLIMFECCDCKRVFTVRQ